MAEIGLNTTAIGSSSGKRNWAQLDMAWTSGDLEVGMRCGHWMTNQGQGELWLN